MPFPDSESRYDLVPILHSHTPGPESYQIQLSRSGHPDSICICLGKLCFSLDGSLPLNKLLSECGGSLKLYVEWSCNLPLLKIYDGVNCVYVSIQEAVLPLSSSGDLSKMCRLLCGKRFARLSIPPASEDAPLVSELIVEVWAMESLCIVSSPSEMKFSMFTAAVRDVLKMLQPGCLDNFHSQSVSGECHVTVDVYLPLGAVTQYSSVSCLDSCSPIPLFSSVVVLVVYNVSHYCIGFVCACIVS